MSAPSDELRARYRELSDEELVSRVASGTLTDAALAVAKLELCDRHIALPSPLKPDSEPASDTSSVSGPVYLETIARSHNLTWIQILRARLEADGVAAVIIDENVNRMNPVFSVAWGGVRLQVPHIQVNQAREILADIHAGRLALPHEPETSEYADSRVRIARLRMAGRQALPMGMLVAYASYRMFVTLSHVKAYWAVVPADLSTWGVVLRPVLYLMACLFLAVRTRLAILIFVAYLVCTALVAVMGSSLRPIDWLELALTGGILLYCLHLLNTDRLT